MKSAYERSSSRTAKGRNATAYDKQYFQLAQKLLCDELSLSLGIERDEVPDFLDERIEKALGMPSGGR